jgi:hypothetical protein
MQPDVTNLAKRIDDDRRRREAELLALLALLFWQCRSHCYAALKVGSDPFRAAADVLQGAPHAGPGLAPRLAAQLALAERAGYRRTLLVLPGETPQPPSTVQAAYPAVQRAVVLTTQILGTFLTHLREALAASWQMGTSGKIAEIRKMLWVWGYDPRRPKDGAWALERDAENAVQAAYQHGYLAGLARPEVRAELTGFQYVATLDEHTSEYCLAYHGVKLPAGHDWLQTHWPSTHHRCRGVMVPLFGDFTATPDADLPYVPAPQPGFGAAPLYVGWPVVAPTAVRAA